MADPPQLATGPGAGKQRGYTLRYPASRQWAIACTVLLILMGLTFAFAVDFLLPDLRDLPFLRDDLPIADSELRRNHTRLVVITKVAVVLGALTAITWLIWQFLAHANAKALSGRGEWLMPAMGVACWFVPGFNLILPPLIMRSLFRTSDPDAVSAEGTRRGRSSLLVWPWWIGWVTGWVLLYFAFRPVFDGDPTFSELITRDRFAIAAGLVAIPTAALGAILLHLVNSRQVMKEDRLIYREWVGWSESA